MKVIGCGTDSLQGDTKFAETMGLMGAKVEWGKNDVTVTGPGGKLTAIDVNMNTMPDAAMTLAVAAMYADGPTTIRDVASWRVKETERMIAICTELRKLGCDVFEGEDYCVITPPESGKVNADVDIDTYDDHRMAMTFSLAACGGVNVIINDPGCTAKTFPTYFDMLESIATHGLLADDGCIICEFRSSSEDRRWSDDWEMLFSRQYGETTVAVLASSTDGGSEEQ